MFNIKNNRETLLCINQLCVSNLANVPTSGIDYDIASWQELDSSFCELV